MVYLKTSEMSPEIALQYLIDGFSLQFFKIVERKLGGGGRLRSSMIVEEGIRGIDIDTREKERRAITKMGAMENFVFAVCGERGDV